jgi:hypothetical protein
MKVCVTFFDNVAGNLPKQARLTPQAFKSPAEAAEAVRRIRAGGASPN